MANPYAEALMQQQPVQAPDPMMLAQVLKAPSGSQQWLDEHAARRVPTGDFRSIDQSLGGQFGKGNIDLNGRPVYQYPGTQDYSSLESMSTHIDGKEVLFPKVVNGKLLSDEEAIAHHKKTGEHLGIFDSPEAATKFAIELERRQQAYYENGPGKSMLQLLNK